MSELSSRSPLYRARARFIGLDRRLRWECPGTVKQLEKFVDVAGDECRIQTHNPFAVIRVGRQRITPQIWHLLPQRPAKSKTPLPERPCAAPWPTTQRPRSETTWTSQRTSEGHTPDLRTEMAPTLPTCRFQSVPAKRFQSVSGGTPERVRVVTPAANARLDSAFRVHLPPASPVHRSFF